MLLSRLPANKLGMIVDKGDDFPTSIEQDLLRYGSDMWHFRVHPNCQTTRAINAYRGEHRSFEYKSSLPRLSPKDLKGTTFAKPSALHFVCSAARALAITAEIKQEQGWNPVTIYEPIDYRCVPEELPELKRVLNSISVLSPNAREALSLLSLPLTSTKALIEEAATEFLSFGVGVDGNGWVVIRSGELGAYVKNRVQDGIWVDAFWTSDDEGKVVDVTGAGNSFLGGLAAGLVLSNGDLYKATFYASISASFIIEQEGLPRMSTDSTTWNGDNPYDRLEKLLKRHEDRKN